MFKFIKTGNFRFKPEVRGRISKLMVSLDSACLITLISTLKLLLIYLKPLKPIISGLNRKCVGGSQNGHQNPLLRHRFTLNRCLKIHYYSLNLKPPKPPKTGLFLKNRWFPVTSGSRAWSRPGRGHAPILSPCPPTENLGNFICQFPAYSCNLRDTP